MSLYKLSPVILLIALLPQLAIGQSRSYPKHQFGIALSTVSGAGLNYQIELNPKDIFLLAGFAYYRSEAPPDDMDLYANLGLQYQNNLYKNPEARIYLAPAFSVWYIEEKNFTLIRRNDVITKIITRDVNRIFNVGLMAGIEYKIMQRLALSAELGLHYQLSERSKTAILIDRNPSGTSYIGIGGGIGIRYAF